MSSATSSLSSETSSVSDARSRSSQSSDTGASDASQLDNAYLNAGWHRGLLGRHAVRQKFPQLKADELVELSESVNQVMGGARAESTKRGYHSVVQGFETWNALHREDLQNTRLGVRVCMYLQFKLEKGQLQNPSAHKYMKMLGTWYGQRTKTLSEWDDFYMQDYQAALQRKGELVHRKAKPLSAAHLVEACRRTKEVDLRVGLMVAWQTGPRCNDLQQMRVKDLIHLEDHLWDFTFPTHKASYTPVTDRSYLPAETHRELMELLMGKDAESKPFGRFYAARVTQLLKQVNPEYTGHSIKRGSIIEALLRGARLEQARVKAKHKREVQTQEYVPPGLIAEIQGTKDLSKFLLNAIAAAQQPPRPLLA